MCRVSAPRAARVNSCRLVAGRIDAGEEVTERELERRLHSAARLGDAPGVRMSAPGAPPRPRRRSSRHIRLVLIGAAASVSGCGEPETAQLVQRDVYEHRSQCIADWGDERQCEVITEGQHRGYWFGPGYVGVRTARPGPSTRVGTETQSLRGRGSGAHGPVSRGGFGATAHAHSSGS